MKYVKLKDCIIDMHQGINTVADKVEYYSTGFPIIQSKNITSGYLDLDDVRYVDQKDYDYYKEYYNPQINDILFTNIGTVGKSILIEENYEFLIAWNLFLIRLKSNYNNKYFLQFFEYLRRQNYYDSLMTGGTVKFINKKKMGEINVPLYDTNKQQEIVFVLDKINSIIDADKKQLVLLDEAVKSQFIEMFEEKDYPIKSLSEIAEYWNGLTYKPSDVIEEGTGTLVLRSSNIQNGSLAFDDNVYVNCKIKEKQYVKENDILMCSRNGSARLVGKVALIKGLEEPTSFGAFMMIIRSDYYPYLKVFFEMPSFRNQLATGTSTINQITGNMLNGINIPVPNLDEVKKFQLFVEQIDKSKFNIQQHLNLMQELLDKKMEEFFGGAE